MSIRDVEKLNSRQIETLQRKHGREVARMNEGQENLKAEIKKGNAEELVDLQHENIRLVASENDKKEKVLEQMKTHLDQTSKMTDFKIKDLKTNTEKVRAVEAERLSANREKLKSDNDLFLEDMGYRFTKEHKKISNDNQNQLRE
nr:hypothetical protein [Bdellovibrionales bacterium]